MCVHGSLFWLCFVLCLLMGYVFQSGETAYETVHYYSHYCCQAHHCEVFVHINASWQILVMFCPLTWNQQHAPACEDSARRCSRHAQMPSSSGGVSGPACRTNCKRKQLFLLQYLLPPTTIPFWTVTLSQCASLLFVHIRQGTFWHPPKITRIHSLIIIVNRLHFAFIMHTKPHV